MLSFSFKNKMLFSITFLVNRCRLTFLFVKLSKVNLGDFMSTSNSSKMSGRCLNHVTLCVADQAALFLF